MTMTERELETRQQQRKGQTPWRGIAKEKQTVRGKDRQKNREKEWLSGGGISVAILHGHSMNIIFIAPDSERTTAPRRVCVCVCGNNENSYNNNDDNDE